VEAEDDVEVVDGGEGIWKKNSNTRNKKPLDPKRFFGF
jgi:hypothetical protein